MLAFFNSWREKMAKNGWDPYFGSDNDGKFGGTLQHYTDGKLDDTRTSMNDPPPPLDEFLNKLPDSLFEGFGSDRGITRARLNSFFNEHGGGDFFPAHIEIKDDGALFFSYFEKGEPWHSIKLNRDGSIEETAFGPNREPHYKIIPAGTLSDVKKAAALPERQPGQLVRPQTFAGIPQANAA
jgi:hypothetical protein